MGVYVYRDGSSVILFDLADVDLIVKDGVMSLGRRWSVWYIGPRGIGGKGSQ
jgi:hypothetical protein